MNEKAIDRSADVALILILPIALLIIFLMATWPVLLAGVVLYFSVNYWQRYRWQKWCQKVNPIFHQLLKENRGSITALDLAMKTDFSAAIANRYLESKAQEFGAQYQEYEDRGRVYYFITASTLGKILDDSEPPTPPQPNNRIMPPSESDQLLHLEGATSTPREAEEQATSLLTDFEALEQIEPLHHSQPLPDLLPSAEDGRRLKEESPPLEHHLSQLEDATPITEATSVSADTAEIPEQVEPSHYVQSVPILLQAELAKRLDVHSSTVYKRRDDPDFAEWSRSRDPEGIAWKFLADTKQFCPLEQLE